MAEVFEVADPVSGRRLALKLLVDTRSSAKRFHREFEALTRLNHPNIVRVYTYGFHRGQPWLTMELLAGQPMQSRVKGFGPPGTPERTREVIRLGHRLGLALDYIHERGLVHRDIKSANVVVLPDGRLKLLDFGTAHLVDPLEQITKEGDFVGTFSYAPPEQVMGLKVDARADLYALGVLLYRLSTGRKPFKSKDPRELARMQLQVTPDPPSAYVQSLPPGLDDLIMALMAKNKADRPQTAREVVDTLEAMLPRSEVAAEAITVHHDLAVGRDNEARLMWRTFGSLYEGIRAACITGLDEDERNRFLAQARKDAHTRGLDWYRWTPEGPGEQGLWKLYRDMARHLTSGPREQKTWLHTFGRTVDAPTFGPTLQTLRRVRRELVEKIKERGSPVLLAVDPADEASEGAWLDFMSLISGLEEAGIGVGLVVGLSPYSQRLGELRRLVEDLLILNLQPLAPEETAVAVAALLHRRAPPVRVARQLHRLSHGRPGTLRNLLIHLTNKGELQPRDTGGDAVQWPAGWAIPVQPVDDFTAQRWAELSGFAQRVMQAATLTGGVLSLHEAGLILGWTPSDARVLVDHMARMGWVHLDADHGINRLDEMLAQAARASMDTMVRRFLASRVVQPDGAAVTLAAIDRLLAAGERARGLQAAVEQAEAALYNAQPELAQDALERVQVHARSPEADRRLRVRYELAMAEVSRRQHGDVDESGGCLDRAASLAGHVEDVARVRLGQADQQAFLGDHQKRRKLLEEAWELAVDHDVALGARVALELARVNLHAGRLPLAQSWFEKADVLAGDAGNLTDAGIARLGALTVKLERGEIEGVESGLQGMVAHSQAMGPRVRWQMAALWAELLRRQGRYSELLMRLEVALREARKAQMVDVLADILVVLAKVELDLHRLGRAQDFVDELIDLVHPKHHMVAMLQGLLVGAHISIESGRPARAVRVAREVMNQARAEQLAVLAAQAQGVLAEALAAEGDLNQSRMHFTEAMMDLTRVGHLMAQADVVTGRARSLATLEEPDKSFQLVQPLLDHKDNAVLQLERQIAEVRWLEAQSQASDATLEEARGMYSRLRDRQMQMERAALRVHPWRRQLRLDS